MTDLLELAQHTFYRIYVELTLMDTPHASYKYIEDLIRDIGTEYETVLIQAKKEYLKIKFPDERFQWFTKYFGWKQKKE